MDMFEVDRKHAIAKEASMDATLTLRAAGQPVETADWPDLVAQMGAEIAGPLTTALERINTLISTGRIDRLGLRALRDNVDAARHAGIIGQQLTRFASGRLRQSHERLQLADVAAQVLSHRSRETHARGITVKPLLKPAEAIGDASLLFSLLNSLLDWALANARSQVELTIENPLPHGCARMVCRFAIGPGDELAEGGGALNANGLDSLTWRLLAETARAMGVSMERNVVDHACTLVLEFPRPPAGATEGVGAPEFNDGFAPSANSQPLAGSHVLVIASRRELRVQIRDALRNMSLIIDFVNSVNEAIAFCREGLPHAIVVEAIQSGERFAQFRQDISAEVPDFVFIEIVEEGTAYELSSFSGTNVARVGREALANSLQSVLIFELSRSL
jgi:hypothetical protein